MTEIVAAHLERAKELVQQLDDEQLVYWSTESGLPIGSIDPAREKAIEIVAAALAACAREGEKPLQKALSDLYHAVSGVGFGHDAKVQKQRLADALKEAGTLLAALERAVGENSRA